MINWYFFFAWYDLWVGLYWDKANRRLYFCPLPCCVILFQFGFKRGWTTAQVVDLSNDALKREQMLLMGDRIRCWEKAAISPKKCDQDLLQHRIDEIEAKLTVVERELNIRNLKTEERGSRN